MSYSDAIESHTYKNAVKHWSLAFTAGRTSKGESLSLIIFNSAEMQRNFHKLQKQRQSSTNHIAVAIAGKFVYLNAKFSWNPTRVHGVLLLQLQQSPAVLTVTFQCYIEILRVTLVSLPFKTQFTLPTIRPYRYVASASIGGRDPSQYTYRPTICYSADHRRVTTMTSF